MNRRRALILGWLAVICGYAADPPRRIISLSPDITEMLYGIGAFPQVAGVSDYCTYPPEVKQLPSVGGWHNPSLEKLASLRPDLVVADEGQAPFIEDKVKALGLTMLVAPDRTIQDVYSTIGLLGRATGHADAAAKLVASTRDELLRVSQKMIGRPKPGVVLIVDRTPGTLTDLYTATEGSYLAELVAIAGGRIVAPATANGYGKLSKEDLLAMNPDIILDFIHGTPSRFAGDPIEAWREIPELHAVKNHQVHGVNQDFVPHASQRIVETARLFARLIHPEVP
jgi:iron complex transport system substrate-binding protein